MTEGQELANAKVDNVIHALLEKGTSSNRVIDSVNRWQAKHNLQGRFIAVHNADVAKIERAHDTLLEMLTMLISKEQALALPLLKELRQVSSKLYGGVKK